MGFLYLMSNLNRSNLGNANIAGMPEEIGLVGNQFGVATTLLYVDIYHHGISTDINQFRNLCALRGSCCCPAESHWPQAIDVGMRILLGHFSHVYG